MNLEPAPSRGPVFSCAERGPAGPARMLSMNTHRDNAQAAPTPPAPQQPPQPHRHLAPGGVESLRSLFWQEVAQEFLCFFPGMVASRPEMADGRLAVLTHAGERIPIKAVEPLFSCSVPGVAPGDRALSTAVQCTVFRIETPQGEFFTLPLQEIRALHVVSEEMMGKLDEAARRHAQTAEEEEPFGFAAFARLAQQQREAEQAQLELNFGDTAAT